MPVDITENFFFTEYTDGVYFNGKATANAFNAPNPTPNSYGVTSGYVSSPNTIQKFSFASDGNATSVGNLISGINYSGGASSKTFGYVLGGGSPEVNTIQKFSFSTDGNATDISDLTQARSGLSGQNSDDNGYGSGGVNPGPSTTAVLNTIDKFPFATDTNATDVGDLTQARRYSAGQSSTTSGYTAGGGDGNVPAYWVVTVDKFPFAADANATDVGDLTDGKDLHAGQSSDSSGYTTGGRLPANTNIIDKFPFASDGNATDVGDLTLARAFITGGQSSSASGYTSGGSPATDVIDKFPFASDGNATDVGDLLAATTTRAGHQV